MLPRLGVGCTNVAEQQLAALKPDLLPPMARHQNPSMTDSRRAGLDAAELTPPVKEYLTPDAAIRVKIVRRIEV